MATGNLKAENYTPFGSYVRQNKGYKSDYPVQASVEATSTPGALHTGGVGVVAAAVGSALTPTTTVTYFAEVFVPTNKTLTGVSVLNGAATDGNLHVGLADATGAVVAQSATTVAQTGTTAFQKVPFTTTYDAKGPARYYVLLQHSTTTARSQTHTVGNFTTGTKTSETYGTFTSGYSATTFTTAVGPIADAY